MKRVTQAVEKQRAFYKTGKTKDVGFRIEQLKKLKAALLQNESNINKALIDDFGKCAFEVYLTEIAFIISSIDKMVRKLRRWARPKSVPKSMPTFHAKSTIALEPFGVVLIISPWNFPVQLTMAPLIGAMAAGNTVIIKPSRYAPNTVAVLKQIIEENFSDEYIVLLPGGREINTELFDERYDYIFFTGGTKTGRIAMSAAAKNLTPITLELGGKNPCIVDTTANIKKAAKSICWGKFLNAGQMCIAPDFVMVKSEVKTQLLQEMKEVILRFYGEDAKQSPDFARIINDSHFKRLKSLIDEKNVYVGGQTDSQSRYIAPTILDNVTFEDAIMKQEIFGPILPIIEYDDEDAMIDRLVCFETPLALYIFSKDKRKTKEYLNRIPSGDAVINDVVLHFGNSNLPFGGKGSSGMGSYHGKHSFDAFSHKRSVVYRNLLLDIPRYAPYEKIYWLIKKLM